MTDTPKRKMGRPARGSAAASRMMAIRLTPEEEQAWIEFAGDRPVRDWAREVVNEHIAQVRRVLAEHAARQKK